MRRAKDNKIWKKPEWSYSEDMKETQICDYSVETMGFRRQCKDTITTFKEPAKQESYKRWNYISKNWKQQDSSFNPDMNKLGSF